MTLLALVACTGETEPVSYVDSASDSTASWCGDGVVTGGEVCDDGNGVGGDGCTPICTSEDGQLEVEPNDDEPNAWVGPTFHGSLVGEDVDCVSFEVEDCASVEARVDAPVPLQLSLAAPTGEVLATGSADGEAAAHLDPSISAGARFLGTGTWSVCAHRLLETDVPYYGLELETFDDGSWPLPDDADGDGVPARCDEDDDDDGVLDDDDNCPDVPNGPDMAPMGTLEAGFIWNWLAAGPYTGTESTESCRPSDDDLIGEDDAAVVPRLGDAAGDAVWRALYAGEDRVQLLTDFGTVDAPREVYVAVYVRSDEARDAVLALGPDDGARAWLNEVEVLDVSGCQGTTVDQFTADVSLPEGWSRLVVKVRDQGGGWGLYARFLDTDGEPIPDLELSLSPDGSWVDDQTDSDSDGIGDACDPEP